MLGRRSKRSPPMICIEQLASRTLIWSKNLLYLASAHSSGTFFWPNILKFGMYACLGYENGLLIWVLLVWCVVTRLPTFYEIFHLFHNFHFLQFLPLTLLNSLALSHTEWIWLRWNLKNGILRMKVWHPCFWKWKNVELSRLSDWLNIQLARKFVQLYIFSFSKWHPCFWKWKTCRVGPDIQLAG